MMNLTRSIYEMEISWGLKSPRAGFQNVPRVYRTRIDTDFEQFSSRDKTISHMIKKGFINFLSDYNGRINTSGECP